MDLGNSTLQSTKLSAFKKPDIAILQIFMFVKLGYLKRWLALLMLLLVYSKGYGAPQIFDSPIYTQNSNFRSSYLTAIGETQDYCIDFETALLRNTPVGPAYKNLNNVASLFPFGVKFSETDNNLWVAQGKGMTWEDVDANNDNDLGEGPAYAGSWSLSNYEQEATTIDFSANPVDYFSCYIGDWDVAGQTETTNDCKITVTFFDNTTQVINTDRIASSQYEFFGFYTGVGGKKIKKVTLECYNNDSQWGLDDVCYGVKAPPCIVTVKANNSGAFCTGSTINLTSAVTGANGVVNYSWTGPGGFTSTLQNPIRANATLAMAGVYNLTITNNGCTASSSTTVVINTTPTATASNTGPYCAGQTISLSSSGGGAYSWAGPNGFTSTLQNPIIASSTAINAGTYTVTVKNNGCSSTAQTNVLITKVNANASSNSPVCKDSVLYLFASGGETYSWSGPNSFSSTLQNPVRSNFQAVDTGVYSVTVTKNGCTSTANVTVKLNSICSSCNIYTSGLQSVRCDNNSSNSDPTDDNIIFALKPTGIGIGAGYNVTVSSGTITPTSGMYASITNFTLQAGSAGGGNVTVTITDATSGTCKYTFVITDPGGCSSCSTSSCIPSSIIKN